MSGFRTRDIVPIGQVRARFSELADAARDGAEKVVTKNGEAWVAIVDARLLDHFHDLERDRVHRLLLDDAAAGVQDVREGRVADARGVLARHRRGQ